MPHSSIWIYVHVVFSTKNRRPLIGADVRARLWAYMGGIARKNEVHALRVGGMADHVHVLLALPSLVSIGDAVREMKAGSSKWFHENKNRLFSWQEGFGAFSVGASNLPEVIHYIENQETHHRKLSFADEWRLLVEKHSQMGISAMNGSEEETAVPQKARALNPTVSRWATLGTCRWAALWRRNDRCCTRF